MAICITFTFPPIASGVFMIDFFAIGIKFFFAPKAIGVFMIDFIAVFIFDDEREVLDL